MESRAVQYRRRLPHIYVENHPIFITWRLKFDLPKYLVKLILEQKEEFEKGVATLSEDYQNLQRYQFAKRQFDLLDVQYGTESSFPTTLRRPEIASIVQNSLHFLDDKKYSLHAYCIMPNHVHLLLTPFCKAEDMKDTLKEITQSLKRYTAREINKVLGREGSFWNRESYDHYARNEDEFYRIVQYIIDNPIKAGLVKDWKKWPYTWTEVSAAE